MCGQRRVGLPEAPLTFLYVTARSMPGPSRVVFFLVRLNSAREKPGRTEVSLIPPVCSQRRVVLPWDEPSLRHTAAAGGHTSPSPCLQQLGSVPSKGPVSEIYGLSIGSVPSIHWIRLGCWMRPAFSRALVPSLATQGSRISNRENIWKGGCF